MNSNNDNSYSGAPVSGRMLKLLLTDGEFGLFSDRERWRERQEKKENKQKRQSGLSKLDEIEKKTKSLFI